MLTLDNFTRVDVKGTLGYYFEATLPDCQVCDVALYLLPKDDDVFVAGDGHRLHGEKTCTEEFRATVADLKSLEAGFPMEPNRPALLRAVEIANEKLAAWNEEKRAAGGA